MRLRIRHLHDGNSTKEQRHNSKYITLCELVDDEGTVVHKTKARCCKYDVPSRKVGRAIAMERMADFLAGTIRVHA